VRDPTATSRAVPDTAAPFHALVVGASLAGLAAAPELRRVARRVAPSSVIANLSAV